MEAVDAGSARAVVFGSGVLGKREPAAVFLAAKEREAHWGRRRGRRGRHGCRREGSDGDPGSERA